MAKTLQELQALGEPQSRIEKIIDFICGKSTDINLNTNKVTLTKMNNTIVEKQITT